MSLPIQGWIYAAREIDGPLVKIGHTKNAVRFRLQTLYSEWHTRFVLLASTAVLRHIVRIEKRVHVLLGSQRIEHEWFYLHMSQTDLDALVKQASIDVEADIIHNGWNGAERAYFARYRAAHRR